MPHCLRPSSDMSSGCAAVPTPPGYPASGPRLSVRPLAPCPHLPSRFPTASCHRTGLCASPACSPHTWANFWPHRMLAGSERRSPRGCIRGTGPVGSPGTPTGAPRERGRAPRCGHWLGGGGAAGRWSAEWSSPWRKAATGSGCPTASAWTSRRCRRRCGWGACSSAPRSCRSQWRWAGSTGGHRRTGPPRNSEGLDTRRTDKQTKRCRLSCRRPAHGTSSLGLPGVESA